MAKKKYGRCSKNSPLLAGLAVFSLMEVIGVISNPSLPPATALYVTAPAAIILGGGALLVKGYTCKR